jgi:hypothetical protein
VRSKGGVVVLRGAKVGGWVEDRKGFEWSDITEAYVLVLFQVVLSHKGIPTGTWKVPRLVY